MVWPGISYDNAILENGILENDKAILGNDNAILKK